MKVILKDLIKIDTIERMLEAFYAITGVPSAITDHQGKVIISVGGQEICLKFHRECKESREQCKNSDKYIVENIHNNEHIFYTCANGLIDCAAPIILEGEHLGAVFTGQFFLEPPDRNIFVRQADKYNYDKEAYLEALDKVPIIPEERVKVIMGFLSDLAKLMAEMSLQRIQQLVKANQTISEKEERLNRILEGSKEGFWEWNIDTGELFLSPRWSEILGYELNEINTDISSWDKLLHPEDRDLVFDALKNNLKGQDDFGEIEYRLLTKNDEWKWISTRGRVIERDENGRAIRLAGTHQDVSRRKNIENELKQGNQELLALNTISQAMNSAKSLKDMASLLHALFVETKAFQGGALFFRDINERDFKKNTDWGLSDDILNFLPQISLFSLYNDVIKDLSELNSIYEIIEEIPQKYTRRDKWQSCVSIPIISEQRMQGILFLFSRAEWKINRRDEIFLKSVGQIIGVAFTKVCLLDQVQGYSKQMQNLSQKLIQVQEEEKQSLARELHDQIGQMLTVVKINLQSVLREKVYSPDKIQTSIEFLDQALEDTRNLSLGLRPILLDDLGLESALRWHLDKQSQALGIKMLLNSNLGDMRFAPELEITCYRIIQESITNAVKHAKPKKIAVNIYFGEDELKFIIENDGKGFNVHSMLKDAIDRKSLGLIGMKERVALSEGELNIVSSDLEDGTVVQVSFKIPPGSLNKRRK